MQKIIMTLALLSAMVAAPSQANESLTDHPLVKPYEGSTLRKKDVKDFDQYNAFMGTDESGNVPTGLTLEGRVTRLFYNKPKDRSIFEVFKNYEMAVEQSGAEILYTCDQEKYECVKAYAGPTLQKYAGLNAMSNTAGHYILARFDEAEHTAYVAIAVGQLFTDIHVVEVKAMDEGMVALDAAALGQDIDTKGYVIVDGIYFDTNKATLKPDSAPALTEVAKLLNERADLAVWVVGHTDSQGSLAHNQALSENRARAVVDELAANYGISRERMEGHGVGPLAPQATNKSDGGRAKNRRVVLVAR